MEINYLRRFDREPQREKTRAKQRKPVMKGDQRKGFNNHQLFLCNLNYVLLTLFQIDKLSCLAERAERCSRCAGRLSLLQLHISLRPPYNIEASWFEGLEGGEKVSPFLFGKSLSFECNEFSPCG